MSKDNNQRVDHLSESDIYKKILQQDDKVRHLRIVKDNSKLSEEEKILLQLKTDYKTLTNKEWSPPSLQKNQTDRTIGVNDSSKLDPENDSTLSAKIIKLENQIIKLKSENKDAETIKTSFNDLIQLKSQYKSIAGHEWQSSKQISSDIKQETSENKQIHDPSQQIDKEKVAEDQHEQNLKRHSHLGMEAKKEDDFSNWYSQVITRGELLEYYDISGCYILRPWCFSIWERIQDYLDKELKTFGVQNCYFPALVSKSVLEKIHKHNFIPEVAWITKVGTKDISEPIAIRPTSEILMYPTYSKWLQSYRDLPIKLNQWNNVVRWELKNPQPFIRNREFLWQEGHTAYANKNDANDEIYKILNLYANMYSTLLAIPTIKGRKTEKEKCSGSDFTTTIEAFIAINGRGIQAATSKYFGQNLSKLYGICYEDPTTQKKKYVYQNAWEITTRSIGIMVMVHSDDKGLVLPPPVAAYQIVIIPCGVTEKLPKGIKKLLDITCHQIEKRLLTAGIRVYADYRECYSPGWKFNHWELKGVPIRLEIGPTELHDGRVVLTRRDTGQKKLAPINDIVFKVQSLLQYIHKSMLQKATKDLKTSTVIVTNWSDFITNLNKKFLPLSPFCGTISCENKIQQDSDKQLNHNLKDEGSLGVKSLCIPVDQPRPLKLDDKCILPDCSKKPSAFTIFGRSY